PRCPDTPSAPPEKIRTGPMIVRGSALGVLRGLTGLLQTGLLPLGGARVAGELPGLLQRGPVGLGVDLVQCTGDRQAQGASLPGGATAVDAGNDVEAAFQVQQGERGVHQLLVQLVREVVLQGAAVHLPGSGAGQEADTGDGLLATAQGLAGGGQRAASTGRRLALGGVGARGVALELLDLGCGLGHGSPQFSFASVRLGLPRYCATWVISKVCGFCAPWGCSAPR